MVPKKMIFKEALFSNVVQLARVSVFMVLAISHYWLTSRYFAASSVKTNFRVSIADSYHPRGHSGSQQKLLACEGLGFFSTRSNCRYFSAFNAEMMLWKFSDVFISTVNYSSYV